MPQSNLALLYANRASSATLSGGGWQPGSLRLDNLKTPYVSQVARSLSASPTNTQFVADLGESQLIGGIAIGPSSARRTAQARIRCYADAGLTLLRGDSGFMAYPGGAVPSLDLEWEDAGFWYGLTQEFDDVVKGGLFIYLPAAVFAARYIKVELFDSGNPAGFIDVSCFFVGRRWVPAHNYSADDNALDFEDVTDEEEGRSGTKFFNPRGIRRVFRFGFPFLPEEGFREVFQIAVRARRHNQVLVVPNPADPTTFQREAFLGNIRQLPSLRRMSSPHFSTNFVIEEAL